MGFTKLIAIKVYKDNSIVHTINQYIPTPAT